MDRQVERNQRAEKKSFDQVRPEQVALNSSQCRHSLGYEVGSKVTADQFDVCLLFNSLSKGPQTCCNEKGRSVYEGMHVATNPLLFFRVG